MARILFSISTGLLVAALSLPAAAQDAVLSSTDDNPEALAWSWFGDLLVRYEHTTDLPGARYDDSLERTRGRGRIGGLWHAMPTLDFGAAIELAAGSDSNDYNRVNNDNERSDSANLDQLFLRWRAGEATSLLFGKAPFPFELSPMVWDEDLRPAGVSVDHSFALGDFDRLQLVAGYFAGQHLYQDDSRIGAIQLAWRWHEGAPTRGAAILSYLDFSDLGQLTENGLARSNRRVNGRLVSDYRLLDLQLLGHTELGAWPFEVRLDLLRNLGADDEADGARGAMILGDRRRANGWEFGFAYQRIQRDGAMAAFNSDDWWFHSAVRGGMPWIGYGLDEHWNLRLAGFHERRDGVNEFTNRVLLDLEARW